MVRNGGRTGIVFTTGFRLALGKDEKDDNIRVYRPETEKKFAKVNSKEKSLNIVFAPISGQESSTVLRTQEKLTGIAANSSKTVIKQLKPPATISLNSMK